MIPRLFVAFLAFLALAPAASAQEGDPLSWMDGEWHGTAMYVTADGPVEFIHTERVGTMLDGVVRLVEGRSYDENGAVLFNAFAVISAREDGDSWEMRSWTQQGGGSFDLQPRADGFSWQIPTPTGSIAYEASFDGEFWRQTGHYLREGAEPTLFFRMDLTRSGDSEWPTAGTVQPNAGE